jgi:hypothetical protein
MAKPELKIFDIMACNVYWDFDETVMPKETHKFLVALSPIPGVVAPDIIESIRAYGPNGYEVKFANQKFNNDTKNGWFFDPWINNYWYMINLPTGFMKEGEYTIEVKGKDGSVDTKSRMQKNAPSDEVVNAYLKTRDRIYESFSPSKKNPLKSGSPRKDVKLSWSTLRDTAGLDAYYVLRLAAASKPKEFDGNNLTWFDNIYLQRYSNNDLAAGKNRNEVVVNSELKPKTDYGYFVEITDSNIAGNANICVFQRHAFFTSP